MIMLASLPAALFLMAAPAPAQSLPPVALVSDCSGQVTWAGGKQLRCLDEVAPERGVVLEPSARLVTVQLASGEELTFQGPGRLRFSRQGLPLGLKPSATRKVPTLDTLRLRPGGMGQAAVVMRNGQTEAPLELLPKGPVLLNPVPEYRWTELPARATYHFQLFDGKGKVCLDQTLTSPGFKHPAESPLEAGGQYTWILEARLPEQAPRIASGRLQLLDPAQRAQLEKAKPKAEAPFGDRLVYAALLEELQLLDEAKVWWQSLLRDRPEQARLRVLASR